MGIAQRQNEYGVFVDALAAASIGTWKVEKDEGREPRMYADATMLKLIGIDDPSGMTPEEIHHAWADRVDPAHLDALEEGTRYMAEGQMAEIQYPWHHPDGRTIIVRCGGVRDRSYTRGLRITGIHQWVTTMHHVDRELEEQRKLIEWQRRLVDGLASEYHTVWTIDGVTRRMSLYRSTGVTTAAGTVEYSTANPGYDEGLAWYVKNFVDESDRARVAKEASWQTLVEDVPESGVYTVTYKRHPAPDRTDYHQMCFARMAGPEGENHFVFAFRDVDAMVREQIEAEEIQRRKLEEARALEKANEAKSQFFSMVSHDIRTPLNAVIGYAELLKLGIADDAEREKAVDSVLSGGHTLLELVNDVLDLSKLESGRLEIVPEPVDAAQLVKDVADAFSASVASKPVEIRIELRSMPWLNLDPHRVRQILFNLVGNAVKFTDEGEVTVAAVYRRREKNRGTLTLEVRDTGCGIPKGELQRITQPYVQVGSSASRSKGTGLGLAICRQLVARMDGKFEIESEEGVGSTFRVVLPGIEEMENARRVALSAAQRIRSAVAGRRRKTFDRVLIVDDQSMNRLMLRSMLTRFGVECVDMAENGREALDKLKTDRYDLVLTDMWMPVLDGEGLVREIRGNPEWKELAVYAITADVEARKNYAGKGFTGVLLKPLTFEKLRELVGG